MLFKNWLSHHQQLVENELRKIFKTLDNPQHQKLLQAIRYGVLDGGKRIRPLLLFSVGEMVGDELIHKTIKPACALELIHCYALIHDDLPAMDDDDLRRGKPSLHKQFDQATAILTGDILQPLAFEILTQSQLTDAQKVRLNQILANASKNMVFGQALDLQFENQPIDLTQLRITHQYKTGNLINAALLMGAVIADFKQGLLPIIETIGNHLGMAFQIKDDILDATSHSTTLGKPAGSDAKQQKNTFISILGLEAAKLELNRHYQVAIQEINQLDFNTDKLLALAELIVVRKH